MATRPALAASTLPVHADDTTTWAPELRLLLGEEAAGLVAAAARGAGGELGRGRPAR